MLTYILSTISILLSIIGTILLYNNGLPSEYKNPPVLKIGGGITPEQEKDNKEIIKWSRVGLICLLLSSVLQVINTSMPSCL